MSGKKRLLVLTSTFPRWKGDHEPPFVFELSRRLGERFEVMVLCPHAPGSSTFEWMDGIEVHRFRYFFSSWQKLAYEGGILANLRKNKLIYLLVPFFIVAEFVSLFFLLRNSRIDVIHAHWLIPQGVVALLARFLSRSDAAILCTSHGGDLYGLSGRLFTWIKRQVIRRVDCFTVVSRAMHNHAEALAGRQDIEVVSMGVDLTERFTPTDAPRDPALLLFVGRLVEKKGVRYLIMAMPEILQHFSQARLVLAGDGPDRPLLQQLAAEMGCSAAIQFVGTVGNASLNAYYREASIFIAPSVIAEGGDQEGLGLVFVEALGCGCAVVASDLPAIADVISDGVTGLVCRQRDASDVASKVIMLLNSAELRLSLATAGRRHVLGRFDWSVITERYSALIERLSMQSE